MTATETAPRPPRWRTVALVISLAFNVLLLAVMGVGVARMIEFRFLSQPGGVFAPAVVMRVLPEDRRPAMQAIEDKHREAMRRDRQQARRARVAAFRVFAAPDYDAAKFDKALAGVHQADDALIVESIAMVKDVVAALTPGERELVAQKARRHGPHWPPNLRD